MSSTEAAALAGAAAARQRLDLVRRSLLTPGPEVLERALEELEAAQQALEPLASACRRGRAEEAGAVREAVGELRREARWIIALLEHAAAWHREWVRLLGALTCGYTPQGEPARPAPAPSLSLEG